MGAILNAEFGDLHSYNPKVSVLRFSPLPHPDEYEGTGPESLELVEA